MSKQKLLSATCASVLILTLSSCSTQHSQQCPTAEKAIEYIKHQVPDALLVKCLPRLLQSEINPSGDPKIAVMVIRTNNGRIDECIKLHELLINHITGTAPMPDDAKPDLKRQQQVPVKEEKRGK